MKWKEGKRYVNPKTGELKTVRVFLLFPKKLNGEWRWLCFSTIDQVYGTDGSYNLGADGAAWFWNDWRWADEKDGDRHSTGAGAWWMVCDVLGQTLNGLFTLGLIACVAGLPALCIWVYWRSIFRR